MVIFVCSESSRCTSTIDSLKRAAYVAAEPEPVWKKSFSLLLSVWFTTMMSDVWNVLILNERDAIVEQIGALRRYTDLIVPGGRSTILQLGAHEDGLVIVPRESAPLEVYGVLHLAHEANYFFGAAVEDSR